MATRAAAQNEQYLELMVTPQFDHTTAIAKELGWRPIAALGEFREELFARGLRDDVAGVRAYLDGRRQSAAAASIAKRQIAPPDAPCKSGTSIKSCGPFLPNRCSLRLCWDSKQPPPIRASSQSTTFSRRTRT